MIVAGRVVRLDQFWMVIQHSLQQGRSGAGYAANKHEWIFQLGETYMRIPGQRKLDQRLRLLSVQTSVGTVLPH
jgi:hypothetical protein